MYLSEATTWLQPRRGFDATSILAGLGLLIRGGLVTLVPRTARASLSQIVSLLKARTLSYATVYEGVSDMGYTFFEKKGNCCHQAYSTRLYKRNPQTVKEQAAVKTPDASISIDPTRAFQAMVSTFA
nr:hypothetical protein [Tanacetum cinerariifolium]